MTKSPIKTIAQIGIVVKDLDATVKTYYDKYGIGPWSYYDMDTASISDFVNEGTTQGYAVRMAAARVGNFEIELLQPLDENSRHARFLREKGEGIEHIAFDGDFDGMRKMFVDNGLEVTTGGTWEGTRFEFFSSQDDLKMDVEIQEWPFDKPYPPADKTYPPKA